jgi:hypothetical protein
MLGLLAIFVALAGTLATIFFIYGCLQMVMPWSEGAEENGKKTIKHALIGLAIAMLSGVMVEFVSSETFAGGGTDPFISFARGVSRILSRAGSKTYTMKVPNFVYFLHDDVYAAFIAGLADSDGSVSGGRIHYHTASPKFLSALAGICSVRGHGGSSTRRSVCLVRRSYNGPLREAIVANMATPRHVEAMRTPSRRQWTLPLTGAMREAIIDQQEDYLHNSVDGELIHTGRLRYDSVVNSCKVSALATLLRPKDSALLQNVASGAAFVTDVASLDSDVDFYDLTVGGDNNYLAGENGFVTESIC